MKVTLTFVTTLFLWGLLAEMTATQPLDSSNTLDAGKAQSVETSRKDAENEKTMETFRKDAENEKSMETFRKDAENAKSVETSPRKDKKSWATPHRVPCYYFGKRYYLLIEMAYVCKRTPGCRCATRNLSQKW